MKNKFLSSAISLLILFLAQDAFSQLVDSSSIMVTKDTSTVSFSGDSVCASCVVATNPKAENMKIVQADTVKKEIPEQHLTCYDFSGKRIICKAHKRRRLISTSEFVNQTTNNRR